MKNCTNTLLFILLTCSSLWAQEQLTFIKSFANEGSNPVYVGSVASKTIFTVSQPDAKRELWVTDGTEAGTFFISNAVPVLQTAIDKFAHGTTNVLTRNGYLYFEAATASAYSELWKTDGTLNGTSKVIDIITELPNSPDRLVYLRASENFFFIAINSSDFKLEISKYTNSFQLVEHSTNSQICYPASPYVFQEALNADCVDISTSKEKIELNGKLYQFYEYNQYAVANFGLAKRTLIVFDGSNSKMFPVSDKNDGIKNSDSPTYRQFSSKYFVYNGQVYALYVGTLEERNGLLHLNVELYVLKEDGFKLQSSLTTEPSMYGLESVWRDQSLIHIITNEKNYSGNSVKVYKHHKIDFEKEYPSAHSVKTIFEGDDGDIYPKNSEFIFFKKDRTSNESFIYDEPSEQIISFVSNLNLFESKVFQTDNGNYFIVASNAEKGSEPYWFDTTIKNFKLLKDINGISKGITLDPYSNEFALSSNPLLWPSLEENGIVLYKSDGTKENTKPLKVLSTDSKSILLRDKYIDNFFSITYDGDKQDYKKLYFSSDGTESGTHILGNFPHGTEIIKSGGNYYCLSNENDGVGVIKFTQDGKSELIRKITRMGLFGIHNVKDDFLLELINTSYDDRILMSALTEKIYTDMVPLILPMGYKYYDFSPDFYEYKAPFQPDSIHNSIHYDGLFKKTGTKDIFMYEKGAFIKLLTFEGDDLIAWEIRGGEMVFYSKSAGKMWITDKTIANTKEIPVLFKDLQLSTIKKVKQDYYFLFTKDGLFSATAYKTQVYKNNTASEVSVPSMLFQMTQGVVDEVPYFYSFDGQGTGSGPVSLDFYKLENDKLTKINSIRIDYTPFSVSQLDNSFFCNPLFSVVFWHPSGYEVVAEGRNATLTRIGDKYIFAAINRDQFGGGRIDVKNYNKNDDSHPANGVSLYITDGTKAGTKLLKGFVDLSYNTYIGYEIKQVGNKVYFTAFTPETGYEPWETDGTPEGTKMVGDLWEGPKSSDPANFKDVNGIPVCLASTPDLGRQLFSLHVKLAQPIVSVPNTEACDGETIILTAPKDFDSYKWIVNETQELVSTDNKLSVTKSGNYKLIVSKAGKSSEPSNAINIKFKPLPAKPVIKQENNLLSVGVSGQLQWYFNGIAIAGATSNTLTYDGVGDYSIKVTENGCSVMSDKLLVAITSTEDEWANAVYPNPATNKLMIKVNQNHAIDLKLIDVQGRVVLERNLKGSANEIDLSHFAKGVYILKLNEHSTKIIIE